MVFCSENAADVLVSIVGKSMSSATSEVDPAEHTSDNDEGAISALLGLQAQATTVKMSHKQVEQNRRLKAKQYFEELRAMLPLGSEVRSDRNRVLAMAIEQIKELRKCNTPEQKRALQRSSCSGSCNDDADSELMFEMEKDDINKLSHNIVEQRRRAAARSYFEELRSLLPSGAKFDKNTVLLHTVNLLRSLRCGDSTSSPHSSDFDHSETDKFQENESSRNLDMLSHSPADVVSFTASNFSSPDTTSVRGRKRLQDERIGRRAIVKQESVENDYKRSRVLGECAECSGFGCPDCDNEGGCRSARCSLQDEEAAFEALSLLSECAAQISQPNAPLILLRRHGEVSSFSL